MTKLRSLHDPQPELRGHNTDFCLVHGAILDYQRVYAATATTSVATPERLYDCGYSLS